MTTERDRRIDRKALEAIREASKLGPHLRIGDRVRLRSGGPTLLVVDVDSVFVTVCARSGAPEHRLPRACFYKEK